jgi:D-arabinose 1-dehydrogenase-like Zn-dependent alcohol dehydrogenase
LQTPIAPVRNPAADLVAARVKGAPPPGTCIAHAGFVYHSAFATPPAAATYFPTEERQMADNKIIAVVGATGAQGGGLVRAILADPHGGFAARAITRDVSSEKARALAQLGAEVVAANVDDEASMERALEGAYGAYFVTFFWDHFSPDK